MNVLLAFLAALVRDILSRIANELWDAIWQEIFRAVASAEQKWRESGQGNLRRQWVVDHVLTFVEHAAQAAGRSLSWIERWVVRLFAGSVADALVGYVNDRLGKDWSKKAAEIEKELAGRLPVIE